MESWKHELESLEEDLDMHSTSSHIEDVEYENATFKELRSNIGRMRQIVRLLKRAALNGRVEGQRIWVSLDCKYTGYADTLLVEAKEELSALKYMLKNRILGPISNVGPLIT